MSEVKLSGDTITMLKSLYEINQSLKMKGGTNVLKTIKDNKVMMAIASIEETIPRDINIYDLREFTNAIALFEDPILDLSVAGRVKIKSDTTNQKLTFIEADPSLITSYIEKSLPAMDYDVVLQVDKDVLAKVLSAATTLRLDYIGFQSDGEKVILTAFNQNNGSNNETSNFTVELDGAVEGITYNMFMKTTSLKILPGNYTVSLCDKKWSKWESKDRELEYTVVFDVNSEYTSA